MKITKRQLRRLLNEAILKEQYDLAKDLAQVDSSRIWETIKDVFDQYDFKFQSKQRDGSYYFDFDVESDGKTRPTKVMIKFFHPPDAK